MATSIGLAGDLKMGQYLKVSVVSFVKYWLRYSSFSGRFPLVPCLHLKFMERSSVCSRMNSVDIGSLMLSIARGHRELWCVRYVGWLSLVVRLMDCS